MAGFDLNQIVGVLGNSGLPGAIQGAGATPQPAGTGLSMEGLFGDPNFINFLAGTGAGLDPNGVGGAVGKATQGMVQNQQMGKAMEKQDKRMQAFIEARKAMAGDRVLESRLMNIERTYKNNPVEMDVQKQLAVEEYLDDYLAPFGLSSSDNIGGMKAPATTN